MPMAAHFMLQEIHQQPEVVRTCLQTYLSLPLPPELHNLEQIHILACGTSRHAGLVGQYWLEHIARIPTRVRSAPEFVAAPLPQVPNTLTVAVTQSGETTDTLAAIKLEQFQRSQTQSSSHWSIGITNQPTSSLAQVVDHILPTLAGVEMGVAATKTFLSQLVVFYWLALRLAEHRGCITDANLNQQFTDLQNLPNLIETILQQQTAIQDLTRWFATTRSCIVLGQGVNRAIALEGALKLKETTYIHAEGYAAGEFMHGPIALLDHHIPVIVIAPEGDAYPQVLAYARKAKASGAPIFGITTQPHPAEADVFDAEITLPTIAEHLSPFLTVIPLQLLAYSIAVQRGLDVDRPRNITKTITDSAAGSPSP